MASGRKGKKQFQDLFDEVIPFSATVDPAAFVDNESQVGDITVTGAEVGDLVLITAGVDLAEGVLSAYVRAADTVEWCIAHVGGDTTNLASSTWKGVVLKFNAAVGNADY